MSDVIPFRYENTSVRTLLVDGEPWLVLADLCQVLGIKNSRDVANRLDDDMKGVGQIDTLGGRQQATIVSEPGMYDVIVRSDSPLARPFRRWVTTEVLPAIRRTGSYGTRELAGPELMARALLEADKTTKAIEASLAEAKPKADTWDALCSGKGDLALCSGKGDLTITDAAKVLVRAGVTTGPRRLHATLEALGWVFRNQRQKWTAKQDRLDQGLLAERVRYYVDDDGVTALTTPQIRITAKGLDRLKMILFGDRELVLA